MQVAIQYYRSHGGEGLVVNETFELVDKVADCKSLFDELEGTLSASWDLMYEQAKKYYDENGDLDVPKRYFTPEGYSLGTWLITQRRVYKGEVNGNLTQVQIDKLNAIGMRWESARDLAWERYYSSAEAYYKKHGDLMPTAKYVDENNVELGSWIARMRVYYNSGIKRKYLSAERIEALEKIGMVWNVPDYLWEENYAAAVRYHREHGDLDVPTTYIDSDGIKLGQWLTNLRSSRKGTNKGYKLTDEQIVRLDALGMIWENKNERRWNIAVNAYILYIKKYHSTVVPLSFVDENGYKLGDWYHRQQSKFNTGKLSPERKQQLESVGMVFDDSDPWEK